MYKWLQWIKKIKIKFYKFHNSNIYSTVQYHIKESHPFIYLGVINAYDVGLIISPFYIFGVNNAYCMMWGT